MRTYSRALRFVMVAGLAAGAWWASSALPSMVKPAAADASVTATEIGCVAAPDNLPSPISFGCTGRAINNLGHVVGSASWGRSLPFYRVEQDFLWTSPDGLTSLAPATVIPYFWGNSSVTEPWNIRDINDRDQVVGFQLDEDDVPRPILWDEGEITYLATANQPGQATGINNRGQVVGWIEVDGQRRAFLWEDGAMTDLGDLGGGTAQAFAINNPGQVVGTTEGPDGYSRGFLWDDGVMTNMALPASTEQYSVDDINERGQVVGTVHTTTTDQPFIWYNGVTTYVGPMGLNNRAHGINNRGQVVGTLGGNGIPQAFLWTAKKGLIQLSSPNGFGPGNEATDINDAGEIAGFGYSSTNGADARPVVWSVSGH